MCNTRSIVCLTEQFAMVGSNYYGGFFVETTLFESIEKPTEFLIDPADTTCV